MLERFFDADAGERLGIYLNDHRAGAVAGQALAERCAAANRGNDLGRYLRDTLVPQVARDREHLDSVCDELGVGRNLTKEAISRAGEFVGRAKPNGKLVGYSPLSRIVEVEGLISGVTAKAQLWHVLLELGRDSTPDGTDLERLVVQAATQRSALEAHHRDATVEAFQH